MGVEYIHYVLPRSNGFFPEPADLAALIDRLIADRWLPAPPSATARPAWLEDAPTAGPNFSLRHTRRDQLLTAAQPLTATDLECLVERNTSLRWHITDPYAQEVLDPFSPAHASYPARIPFDIGFDWSPAFIYRHSESIEPFPDPRCCCGHNLHFQDKHSPFTTWSFLHSACPRCGKKPPVHTWPATLHDPATWSPTALPGGATARFSMIIDRGESIPEAPLQVSPRLLSLLSEMLRCDLYEVGEYC